MEFKKFGQLAFRSLKNYGLVAVTVLAGCGGGNIRNETAAILDVFSRPPPVTLTSLLVVGNSITRHAPLPARKWHGEWGMAASSQEADFAHLAGAALNLPVTAVNESELEKDANAPVPAIAMTPTTAVVIELGDNGLPAKYVDLLRQLKAGKLVCLSTWWEFSSRDRIIKAQCEAAGGNYVYIGDIFPHRKDVRGLYDDRFVDAHPHDQSMRQIAERVAAAVRLPPPSSASRVRALWHRLLLEWGLRD